MKQHMTPQAIAKYILELLPEDGSPVLNRVMLTMIARRSEVRIDPEQYSTAVDTLAQAGKIGRSRGQGGKVFLLQSTEPTGPPEAQHTGWTESALMAKLDGYLRGPFRRLLDIPCDASWTVADTSTIGPRTGRWARPDFVAVSIMRFQLLPGRQVDVHSFELKAENGGTVQGVHEALAQTRFTHFGHLVWHVPERSKAEARLPEIEQQCEIHGIGLIIIRSPDDYKIWEIRLDPEQKNTAPATVDAFLLSRFSGARRAELTKAIVGE